MDYLALRRDYYGKEIIGYSKLDLRNSGAKSHVG